MQEYVKYYNNDRTHYNLGKDAPSKRKILKKPYENSKVTALPRCGGIHHKYIWQKSA